MFFKRKRVKKVKREIKCTKLEETTSFNKQIKPKVKPKVKSKVKISRKKLTKKKKNVRGLKKRRLAPEIYEILSPEMIEIEELALEMEELGFPNELKRKILDGYTRQKIPQLRLQLRQPEAPKEKVERMSEMERYFAVKNDILRFNISRSSGVLNEGNDV